MDTKGELGIIEFINQLSKISEKQFGNYFRGNVEIFILMFLV